MTGFYIPLGAIVLFAVIVAVWDLIAERHNRRHPRRR
jgi:hypothetical protein